MIADIFFWIFAGASTLYVVHLGFYLVGANLYDARQYRRLHHHHKHGAALSKRQALVSVLVPAHNEQLVIVRCLESIRRSTYKNLQVIVVDDASTDATLAIARNYKRRHRGFNLHVVRMRDNVGKGKALNHVLENFARGEFAMTVDADSMLAPTAISHAVTYFADPKVAGVAANVRVIEEPKLLGILQKFEHMIGYRSKKVYSLTNCEFVVGGVASTYRMDVLRKVGFYDTDTITEDIGLSTKVISSGNRDQRVVYGADVSAMTEGVGSFRGLLKQRYRWKYGSLQNIIKYRRLIGRVDRRFTPSLTIYRLPTAILSEIVLLVTPFIWGYIIYMTIAAGDPRLIVGAYATVTLYTLVTLWFDEHTTMVHRLRLSLYAPIAYPIFYIMDIVQFVAISRCMFRAKSLLGQKDTGSTWVSPQRVGGEVASS